MDAIRIENLRSLTDTGFVDLKPITLLVGQNSSGKSSFLRFFPLLRQSVEARTEGPISFYGRLVDFGSFQEALNRKSEKQEMVFHFRMVFHFGLFPSGSDKFDIYLTLKITKDKIREGILTKECLISFGGHQIKIEFDDSRKVRAFRVNTFDLLSDIKGDIFDEKTGYFLPRIEVIRNSDGKEENMRFADLRDHLSDSAISEVEKKAIHLKRDKMLTNFL
ncbi:AAA family ATPase [Desulfococcaceae bacterium HSG8]|nr:AAA family ATPase [Desulfococcaceae bacterium HSG8]